MNADHKSERSERVGAVMLPPAVTRWRKASTRTEYHAPMAPPFRAAARKAARVALGPFVPEPEPENQAVQARPTPEDPAVAPLSLAPPFAEEIGDSGAPIVAEPLDMVEFGAMIEPLENGAGEDDPWHDPALEFADEVELAAELEAAAATLAPQGDATEVSPFAEKAEAEPVFIALEPAERPQHPHQDLSERLQRLALRLRDERPEDLLASLAAGDRVDHLLAGFLAGYFSTRND